MAILEYLLESVTFTIFTILVLYYYINRSQKRSSPEPFNWPLLGMMPSVLQRINRGHDQVTKILAQCGGTYTFKGPWFCNLDMVFTSDPVNIQYVLSRNFSNYPKGLELKHKFDFLGDGIFTSDFEIWELHRRVTLSLMSNAKFFTVLESSVSQKIDKGLIPVLDHFFGLGSDVDLQDIFQRFAFDNISKLVLDYDPMSLSTDLPHVPCEKAFSSSLENVLHRYLLPEFFWKLQRWLGIGREKELLQAWKDFDEFVYPHVSTANELHGDNAGNNDDKDENLNMLRAFRKAYTEKYTACSNTDLRNFLRDAMLGLLFAGRDTVSICLTWFFYLVAKNPFAQNKILEEIQSLLPDTKRRDENMRCFTSEECSKLVYLHGALCETLRLFPPLALQYKAPVQSDVLPSGHKIDKNAKLIISFFSVGRMESIWGKDCRQFKPERWITPRGGIKHEPSNKFPAFNVGPRTCLGKEMSFVQMKMVAASIIRRYQIELVKGHRVVTRYSIMLQAKYGLRVRLLKRSD